MADTKIADIAANMGSDSFKRTPDAVLEVNGGTFHATTANSKPSFLVRSAPDDSVSGKVGTQVVSLVVSAPATAGQAGNVGIGTAAPAAALEVNSTTSGFLPPRMTTTQIDAISSPATGSMVYNTSTSQINVNIGEPTVPNWQALSSATSGASGKSASFDISAGSTDSIVSYNNGSYGVNFRLNSTSCSGNFKVQMQTVGAPSDISVKKSLELWTNNIGNGGMPNATITLPNSSTWTDAQSGTVVISNDDTYTLNFYNFSAPFDAYRLTVVASTTGVCRGFLNVEKLN